MMRSVTTVSAASGAYGAVELKHHYRKNMMLGVSIAATAHLAIVGGVLLWQAGVPVPFETVPARTIIIDDPSNLAPPPSMILDMPKLSDSERAARGRLDFAQG